MVARSSVPKEKVVLLPVSSLGPTMMSLASVAHRLASLGFFKLENAPYLTGSVRDLPNPTQKILHMLCLLLSFFPPQGSFSCDRLNSQHILSDIHTREYPKQTQKSQIYPSLLWTFGFLWTHFHLPLLHTGQDQDSQDILFTHPDFLNISEVQNSITSSTRFYVFYTKQAAIITQSIFILTNIFLASASHLSSQQDCLSNYWGNLKAHQESLFHSWARRLVGSGDYLGLARLVRTQEELSHHQGCGHGSCGLFVPASQFSLLSHVANRGPRHIILRVGAQCKRNPNTCVYSHLL